MKIYCATTAISIMNPKVHIKKSTEVVELNPKNISQADLHRLSLSISIRNMSDREGERPKEKPRDETFSRYYGSILIKRVRRLNLGEEKEFRMATKLECWDKMDSIRKAEVDF